jgi:hypothetical protein
LGWAGSPVVQRDAVLSVQLGGLRPTGERAVEPFLEPPGGELSVAVEPELETRMAGNVVDAPKSVVGPVGASPITGGVGRARWPRW